MKMKRCAMTDQQFPNDSIFISWGRFRAGIIGRFAIIVVAIGLAMFVARRSLGLF
jgi:hypothetical protein